MRYEDMLHMPHHVSSTRPHMTLEERAAQFSPFAALTGYGDLLSETARQTEAWMEPGADDISRLDTCLQVLQQHLPERPAVTVTFFQPDSRKEGGSYRTLTGTLHRIDPLKRVLILDSGEVVPLRYLTDLSSPLLDRCLDLF